MDKKLEHFLGWTIVGTLLFTFIGMLGGWGSRGIKNIYTFNYQGKPAKVQQDDRVLGFDKYWILLNNGTKINEGKVINDEGKIISVSKKESYYRISEK